MLPALAVLAAGLACAGCRITSHSEKAEGVDFSRYKTFAWENEDAARGAARADNDMVDNNIKNSVSQQLEQKGWKESVANPDVLLNYTVAIQRGTRRETEPVYSMPRPVYLNGPRGMYTIWYPSLLMGYHSYNTPLREGELTINMFDAKTSKLVWQGWAKGDLGSGRVTTKEATAQVKSIFKKFNYPNS